MQVTIHWRVVLLMLHLSKTVAAAVLVVYYFYHGLATAFWRFVPFTFVPMRAANFVVCFGFVTALFALKLWQL
jgi:hypothetical protein